MKKMNEKSKLLAELLNKTKMDDRVVVYTAIAMVVVDKLLNKVSKTMVNRDIVIRSDIKDIVYDINELAILDKTLLEKQMLAVFKLKTNVNEDEKLILVEDGTEFSPFLSSLGIYNNFSPALIQSIDENISLYNRAVARTLAYIKG